LKPILFTSSFAKYTSSPQTKVSSLSTKERIGKEYATFGNPGSSLI